MNGEFLENLIIILLDIISALGMDALKKKLTDEYGIDVKIKKVFQNGFFRF
jgi:hypothetical protein